MKNPPLKGDFSAYEALAAQEFFRHFRGPFKVCALEEVTGAWENAQFTVGEKRPGAL